MFHFLRAKALLLVFRAKGINANSICTIDIKLQNMINLKVPCFFVQLHNDGNSIMMLIEVKKEYCFTN